MARIIFGDGLSEPREIEVPGVTLGEVLSRVRAEHGEGLGSKVRVFVDGMDASRLEGEDTPVGDEDTVLLTTF